MLADVTFFEETLSQSKEGIILSMRKYALDILEEIGMINYRPIDSPMDPNQKLFEESKANTTDKCIYLSEDPSVQPKSL